MNAMSADDAPVLRALRVGGPATLAELAQRVPIPRYRIRAVVLRLGLPRVRVPDPSLRGRPWRYSLP